MDRFVSERQVVAVVDDGKVIGIAGGIAGSCLHSSRTGGGCVLVGRSGILIAVSVTCIAALGACKVDVVGNHLNGSAVCAGLILIGFLLMLGGGSSVEGGFNPDIFSTRRIVIGKYGIPAEKVVTVHNAVRFGESEDAVPERAVKDKVVTFLGRITYQKGPDYFVEAAAKVLQRVPDVRFVMAGSGDLMNHVVRRVAQLGIADRFHFTGFLKGGEVQRMFRLSDVYVMPSVSEPFGISPLEAMRSGVPVIISRQSGVAEVLDYAIKVNYWDVDALADAIYGLLTYPALGRMFASKGLEEVTGLKWTNAAAKIKTVYETVVAEANN